MVAVIQGLLRLLHALMLAREDVSIRVKIWWSSMLRTGNKKEMELSDKRYCLVHARCCLVRFGLCFGLGPDACVVPGFVPQAHE